MGFLKVAQIILISLALGGSLFVILSPYSVRVYETTFREPYADLGPIYGIVRHPTQDDRHTVTLKDYQVGQQRFFLRG